MNITVAQLGARRHYVVPRAYAQAGRLERFYTDICSTVGWPRMLRKIPFQPGGLRRLVERRPDGIPEDRIRAFSAFGVEYWRRCGRARSSSERTEAWLWGGRKFCGLVTGEGFGTADGVYGFNSASLEMFDHARREGRWTVLDQTIAPRRIEREIIDAEGSRFPDWENVRENDAFLDEYCDREAEEWSLADLILCGSDFVRDGIVRAGGPRERCMVVPFAAPSKFTPQDRPAHGGPLRVLTVGTVGLRKGTPYVLEAARRLRGTAEFRIVGPLDITREATARLSGEVDVVGPVPRSAILDHYRWADVFLLPTLCEGSAGAIFEAMATSLPVICTPNAGSVVRDGVDGFIVPPASIEPVIERISELADSPDLRSATGESAGQSARGWSEGRYQERLVKLLERFDPNQRTLEQPAAHSA